MTDLRKTCYVGSGGHKYYPCGLLSPNVHILYLVCISVLIGLQQKVKYPEFCMGYIDETWYVGIVGHKY